MREKHRQRDSDSQCVCGARRRERRGIVQHKSAPPDARPPELHTADQHTEQQGGDEPKVCAVIRGADRSVGPGTVVVVAWDEVARHGATSGTRVGAGLISGTSGAGGVIVAELGVAMKGAKGGAPGALLRVTSEPTLTTTAKDLLGVRDDYYGGNELFMHEDILHSSNPRLFPLRRGSGKHFPLPSLANC